MRKVIVGMLGSLVGLCLVSGCFGGPSPASPPAAQGASSPASPAAQARRSPSRGLAAGLLASPELSPSFDALLGPSQPPVTARPAHRAQAPVSPELRAAFIASEQASSSRVYDVVGTQAHHAEQKFHTQFEADEVRVEPDASERGALGLKLARLGCGAERREVASGRREVSGNRVSYVRPELGLEEWYVHGKLGLEQGFTLAGPPCEDVGELALEVGVSGGLVPVLAEEGERVEFWEGGRASGLQCGELHAVDADGAVLPSEMSVEAGRLVLRVDARGARWPVVVDPLFVKEQAKIFPDDPLAGKLFGSSANIWGNTAIVGAYADNSKGNFTGAAYIFTRSGSDWTQQAKLVHKDAAAGDYAGVSVSVYEDTAVFGAPVKGSVGAAYVFVRGGTAWNQQAKLVSSNPKQNYFGGAVAVWKDTILVGDSLSSDPTLNKGDITFFTRSGNTWSEQARFLSPGGAGFGKTVSLDGDTALIGTYPGSSVFVYRNVAGTWGLEATFVVPGPPAKVRDVALSGNFAIVGSPGDIEKGANAGAAYVFERNGGAWGAPIKLLPSDASAGDYLGVSVGISGNIAIVGVGALGNSYVFVRDEFGWTERAKVGTNNVDLIEARSIVGISNDTIIIGASQNNDQGLKGGAAYISRILTSTGSPCGPLACEVACVDGVCCDKPCDAACNVCSKAAGGAEDGVCSPLPPQTSVGGACGLYLCGGADVCPSSCVSDQDCSADAYCSSSGKCSIRKGAGAACNPAQGIDCNQPGCRVCETGFCSDGVCCDQACGEACDVCTKALGSPADGSCGLALEGYPGNPVCQGSKCSGKSASCQGGCFSDVSCSAELWCDTATNACLPDLKNGGECSRDAQCSSGFCIDGVCCDTSCSGACKACSAAKKGYGNDGVCQDIQAGADPDSECPEDATTTCKFSGSCDGKGACAQHPQGTSCGQTACADGQVTGQICDGQGVCTTSVQPVSCFPYLLCTDTATCASECASDNQCAPAYFCDTADNPPTCKKDKIDGATCKKSGECASGSCVDGVCCDTACDGGCQFCAVEGSKGTCTTLLSGKPLKPGVDCGSDPTCGGECKGKPNDCSFPAQGTECAPAKCASADVSELARTCDGSGKCEGSKKENCAPFVCDSVLGGCKTKCSSSKDCATGAVCGSNGQCTLGEATCADKTTAKGPDGTLTKCEPYSCLNGQCRSSCSSDLDCVGSFVCQGQTCVPQGAGGSAGSAGSSAGGAGSSAGGAGSSAGGAGSSAGGASGAGKGGAGGAAGGAGGTGAAAEEGDDGGCGCRAAGSSGSGASAALLLGLALAARSRRSRRLSA